MNDAEAKRLEALQRYHILDTPPEPAFDDLVHLAAQLCNAPIAAVALVAAERVWCKARLGFTVTELPRADSIAAYTIAQTGTFVVRDTLAEDRKSTRLNSSHT